MDDSPEDEEEITLPETHEEAIKMSKEHKQSRKDNGLPPLEDIPWDDGLVQIHEDDLRELKEKARDDNDAQLDDVYPEDAPHEDLHPDNTTKMSAFVDYTSLIKSLEIQ